VNCIRYTFEGQVKGSNNKISTIGEKIVLKLVNNPRNPKGVAETHTLEVAL
jgi:hypothetical protein